jgi:hypothetical protein
MGGKTLPFIMNMHEEDVPLEDGSKGWSRRKKTNGITLILASWPKYITIICMCLAVIFILAVLIMFIVLAVSRFRNRTADVSERNTEPDFLNIDAHCNYQYEEDRTLGRHRRGRNNIFDSVRFHQPSFGSPKKHIDVGDLSIPAEHKVFLIAGNENLPSLKLCAIESAAKFMKNHNFYLIILSMNNTASNTVSDRRLDQLITLHPNVKVFRLNGDEYFHGSPLRGILHKSELPLSLLVFAARVLTLWRYGGITYDLDLITHANTGSRAYPFPDDASVMISEDGDAMSTSLQCHTFLYTVMISLTSMYRRRQGSQDASNSVVLEHAMDKFCDSSDESESDTKGNEKAFDICRGITTMPTCMICKNGEQRDTDCMWIVGDAASRLETKGICPISYRKHKPKPLSDINTIKFYEMRYMNLPQGY